VLRTLEASNVQRPRFAAVAHIEFRKCSHAERRNLFLKRREAKQSHNSKPLLAAALRN
jgi:hypothetical protein